MFHLLALLFYGVLSIAFIPHLLPIFSSAIPGGLEDTRVFLWNAWWFRYAIDTLHTTPFFTKMLFHPFGVSLVSHDFPMWTNGVTYLAQAGGFNWVAASNVWFLLTWMLSGFCSYLLVWEVTKTRAPAVVAGLYVMTHSYTLARTMQNWGQFNLYAIALFLWTFMRARYRGRRSDYVISGIALAWTAACHYYFFIYSATIWVLVAFVDLAPWRIRLSPRKPLPKLEHWRKFIGGIALVAGIVAAWIVFAEQGAITLGRLRISLQTPVNALLVMWISLGVIAFSQFRVSLVTSHIMPEKHSRLIKHHLTLGAVAAIFLLPLMWATLRLIWTGGYPKQSILWKTHLPGADLVSLLMPNSMHMLWGADLTQWFESHGMNAQEQAAGIGWVCLFVFAWSRIWKPKPAMAQFLAPGTTEPFTRHWFFLAVFSSVLAMGTYLHVFFVNFWLPLPFYVWRLLPIMGNVRVPERWMAVGAIAWSVVLGLSLVALARRKNWSVNRLCVIVGVLILAENWPGIPVGSPPIERPIYETLQNEAPGAVLPLPLYIGDSSIGAGNAPPGLVWENLGAQIYHQHPVLGGYVGRIQRQLIANYKADPFFARLLDLEEEKPVSDAMPTRKQTCQTMKEFQVTYVLAYPSALNPATQSFIEKTLPLQLISKERDTELYAVACPQ